MSCLSVYPFCFWNEAIDTPPLLTPPFRKMTTERKTCKTPHNYRHGAAKSRSPKKRLVSAWQTLIETRKTDAQHISNKFKLRSCGM